jgi:hypothetical protein
MSNWKKRSAAAVAFASAATMLTGVASAQSTQVSGNGRWTAASEVVGQTSTGTVASGGNPIYLAPKPQYSGAVGLLIDNAFVCSGAMISRTTILTAAHCVSNGGGIASAKSVTAFFYGGQDDPALYANGSPADRIAVNKITVNSAYSGQVVDQNDIAILRLSEFAPDYAPDYDLAFTPDLTGVNHTIAGYGLRSINGGELGTTGANAAGTGRLRYADNRFDFRFGDADFEGYFTSDTTGFGARAENVWLSDFDNGTAFRDNSCNIAGFEMAAAPAIFSKAVFSSGKYCNLGRGEREGIGAGGDSGSSYFVDGKIVAVHSFGLWYREDESANRFGQFKGAVSVDFHKQFILDNVTNAVPEPATWAMMIGGFGLVGGAMRRSRKASVSFA